MYLVRFAAVANPAHEERNVRSHIGELLAVQIWKVDAASVVAAQDKLVRSEKHAPAAGKKEESLSANFTHRTATR